MIFRDEHERKAHDVICIVKYGSVGGSVATKDVRRVGDILRGHTLDPPKPKINIVVSKSLPPGVLMVTPPGAKIAIHAPTIDATDSLNIKLSMPFKVKIPPP